MRAHHAGRASGWPHLNGFDWAHLPPQPHTLGFDCPPAQIKVCNDITITITITTIIHWDSRIAGLTS